MIFLVQMCLYYIFLYNHQENLLPIYYFVKEYTNDNITDYQAAALIMAIYINGMSENEVNNLTISMANSGETINFSGIKGKIVDKHSTGGVGDKVTLILMPVMSSLGIPIVKMSGRGLRNYWRNN